MDNEIATKNKPWYCLRLFSLKTYEIRDYFKRNDIETFIPEQWKDFEDSYGHVKHELRPVVKNLLFVQVPKEEEKLKQLIMAEDYKMTFIKTNPLAQNPATISSKEMEEFKIMCNPELNMTQYISEDEAKIKKGDRVIVLYGPLKGLSGRLVRRNSKYYLLKEVPGIGVMLKVSRWCCRKQKD